MFCFKSNYSDHKLEVLDRRWPDTIQEHRPITFELNLNAVTLSVMGKPARLHPTVDL